MITPEGVEYVKKRVEGGATREQVTQELMHAGWQATDIRDTCDAALKVAPTPPPPPAAPVASTVQAPVHEAPQQVNLTDATRQAAPVTVIAAVVHESPHPAPATATSPATPASVAATVPPVTSPVQTPTPAVAHVMPMITRMPMNPAHLDEPGPSITEKPRTVVAPTAVSTPAMRSMPTPNAAPPVSGRTSLLSIVSMFTIACGFIGIFFFSGVQEAVTLTPLTALASDQYIHLAPYVGGGGIAAMLLAILGVFAGLRLRRRDDHPVFAFVYGASLYLLIVFVMFGTPLALSQLPFFGESSAQAANAASVAPISHMFLQVFFAGFVITLVLQLIMLSVSKAGSVGGQSGSGVTFRAVVIVIVILLTLYVTGAAQPLASLTKQSWACMLVYGGCDAGSMPAANQ